MGQTIIDFLSSIACAYDDNKNHKEKIRTGKTCPFIICFAVVLISGLINQCHCISLVIR